MDVNKKEEELAKKINNAFVYLEDKLSEYFNDFGKENGMDYIHELVKTHKKLDEIKRILSGRALAVAIMTPVGRASPAGGLNRIVHFPSFSGRLKKVRIHFSLRRSRWTVIFAFGK